MTGLNISKDEYLHWDDNFTTDNTPDFDYDAAYQAHIRRLFLEPHRIIALTLGFLAISLNILSIMAILRGRNKLSSHYRFIVSLAVSDIFIGLTVSAHMVNFVVNPNMPVRHGTWGFRMRAHCFFVIIKALNTSALNITLLNLMGMAIDHFLAILRPLHYPCIMNEKRATMIIVLFWAIALICGFSDFLSVYPWHARHLGRYNFCELVRETPYQEEFTMFVIAIICFFVMTTTYIRMFVAIKQRHLSVGLVQHEQRNKKALYTTLIILGTFVLCWLPQCLFQVSLIIAVKVDRSSVEGLITALMQADQYLYDLLLLNAILDPLIYAIRMKEVQSGYRRLFGICCKPFVKERRYSMTEQSNTTVLLDENRKFSPMPKGSMRMSERYANGRRPLMPPSVRVQMC